MATGDCIGPERPSPDGIDPRSVLALPFVADVPDASKPGRTTRKFWVVPSIEDYAEACRIGVQWAAQYIAWQAASKMPHILVPVMRDMAACEAKSSALSEARGFAVGFFDGMSELAVIGAQACGGAARYGDLKEREQREWQAKQAERDRAETSTRVSRMNTGRRAKRAQRDTGFQQFKARLISGVVEPGTRNPVKPAPRHDA